MLIFCVLWNYQQHLTQFTVTINRVCFIKSDNFIKKGWERSLSQRWLCIIFAISLRLRLHFLCPHSMQIDVHPNPIPAIMNSTGSSQDHGQLLYEQWGPTQYHPHILCWAAMDPFKTITASCVSDTGPCQHNRQFLWRPMLGQFKIVPSFCCEQHGAHAGPISHHWQLQLWEALGPFKAILIFSSE